MRHVLRDSSCSMFPVLCSIFFEKYSCSVCSAPCAPEKQLLYRLRKSCSRCSEKAAAQCALLRVLQVSSTMCSRRATPWTWLLHVHSAVCSGDTVGPCAVLHVLRDCSCCICSALFSPGSSCYMCSAQSTRGQHLLHVLRKSSCSISSGKAVLGAPRQQLLNVLFCACSGWAAALRSPGHRRHK